MSSSTVMSLIECLSGLTQVVAQCVLPDSASIETLTGKTSNKIGNLGQCNCDFCVGLLNNDVSTSEII